MDLKTYLVESKRTLKENTQEMNLFHASMGITTEKGELFDNFKRHFFYGKELDLVNLKEELGDVMWYVAIPIRIYDQIKFDFTFQNLFLDKLKDLYDKVHTLKMLRKHADKLCDELDFPSTDENLINAITQVIYHICLLGYIYSLSFEDILETNINKLRARFPDVFTNELALTRDLDLERRVLEGQEISD